MMPLLNCVLYTGCKSDADCNPDNCFNSKACQAAVCNLSTSKCEVGIVKDGQKCNDGVACTENDGECSARAKLECDGDCVWLTLLSCPMRMANTAELPCVQCASSLPRSQREPLVWLCSPAHFLHASAVPASHTTSPARHESWPMTL